MNVFVLAVALALGPADPEDRLPRSLSDAFVQTGDFPVGEEHAVLAGIHFGSADGVDAEDPCFVAGFEWRIHILSWLSAGASLDYQSPQKIEDVPGAHIFQIPVQWSVLLSPPIDLGPFRPYGLVGGGFTITHISGSAARLGTDLNFLGVLGFGLEVALGPNVVLDANVRYVWSQDPANTADFSADWAQVTVGVLVKLSK